MARTTLTPKIHKKKASEMNQKPSNKKNLNL